MGKLKKFLDNNLGSRRKWKLDEVYQKIQEFGKKNHMRDPQPKTFGPCLSAKPDGQFKHCKGHWNREASKKMLERDPFLVLVSPE